MGILSAQKAKLAKGGKPQKGSKKKEGNDNKTTTPTATKQPEEQEPKKSKQDRIDDREARLWQMNDDFNQTVRQLKEEQLPGQFDTSLFYLHYSISVCDI